MKFPAVDSAIDVCERHLATTSSRGSEVEAYLARYLLLVIYAAYEAKVKELVALRGMATKDARVGAFVQSAADRLCRSIEIGEIKGLVGRFGGDYKEKFGAEISDEIQAAYDSIITNRHAVAHDGQTTITFDELVRFYRESEVVMDAVERCLELVPA